MPVTAQEAIVVCMYWFAYSSQCTLLHNYMAGGFLCVRQKAYFGKYYRKKINKVVDMYMIA